MAPAKPRRCYEPNESSIIDPLINHRPCNAFPTPATYASIQKPSTPEIIDHPYSNLTRLQEIDIKLQRLSFLKRNANCKSTSQRYTNPGLYTHFLRKAPNSVLTFSVIHFEKSTALTMLHLSQAAVISSQNSMAGMRCSNGFMTALLLRCFSHWMLHDPHPRQGAFLASRYVIFGQVYDRTWLEPLMGTYLELLPLSSSHREQQRAWGRSLLHDNSFQRDELVGILLLCLSVRFWRS